MIEIIYEYIIISIIVLCQIIIMISFPLIFTAIPTLLRKNVSFGIGTNDIFSLSGDGNVIVIVSNKDNQESTINVYKQQFEESYVRERLWNDKFDKGQSIQEVSMNDDGTIIGISAFNNADQSSTVYIYDKGDGKRKIEYSGFNSVAVSGDGNAIAMTKLNQYGVYTDIYDISKDKPMQIGNRINVTVNYNITESELTLMNKQTKVLLSNDASSIFIATSANIYVYESFDQDGDWYCSGCSNIAITNEKLSESLAITDSGDEIAFVDENGDVKLTKVAWSSIDDELQYHWYDMNFNLPSAVLKANSVATSGNGNKMIIGSDFGANIYSFNDGNWKQIQRIHSKHTTLVKMDRNGEVIAMNGKNGGVYSIHEVLPLKPQIEAAKVKMSDAKLSHLGTALIVCACVAVSAILFVFAICHHYRLRGRQYTTQFVLLHESESAGSLDTHVMVQTPSFDIEHDRDFERSLFESSTYGDSCQSLPLHVNYNKLIRKWIQNQAYTAEIPLRKETAVNTSFVV